MKYTFPLLAFACTTLAADNPSPQIVVSARFTETENRTGKVDVLSSPMITSREGQAARIEMLREVALSLSQTKIKDAAMVLKPGVVLDLTGWLEDDGIVLRGTASVRELDGNTKISPDGSWAHLRVDEVPFVLRLKDGEPRDFPLTSTAHADRKLTIQITAKKHVPVNASPLYWQAFAAMPKLDDVEKKVLDAKSVAPGDADRALAAKADVALKLLHEASHADYCDWNLDLSKGPALQLPHLATARELAKLALVKARVSDAREAFGQQEAVLRMARHVGATPLLVSRLVDVSIEAMAIDSIASMLPQWPEEVRNHVGDVLSSLASVPSIADCVAAEGESMSTWLTNELDAEVKKCGKLDAAEWLGKLVSIAPVGVRSNPPARTEADLRELIRRYRIVMSSLAKMNELPLEEFRTAAANFKRRIQGHEMENILVEVLAPAMDKMRPKELQAETRLALLRAALEVQSKGESALSVDLATYRKTEHGFELTSKEQFDGKPVVLVVGPR